MTAPAAFSAAALAAAALAAAALALASTCPRSLQRPRASGQSRIIMFP